MPEERSELSEGAMKRLRDVGLEPEEMSEEQLRAIDSLEQPQKYHWLPKVITYVGGSLLFGALLCLLSADWMAGLVFSTVGVIALYVSYRIQAHIAARRFVEASIKKHREKQQSEQKELWGIFRGQENTDELLVQKARLLATVLCSAVSTTVECLFDGLREDSDAETDDDARWEVTIEMALFYLHVLDRIAFQYLPLEKRDIFMDTLCVEMRESYSRLYDSGIEAERFRNEFGGAYNGRQIEYGKYKKWVPEKDEGAKGTLFWEFGKKIARIIGSETNIGAILLAQDLPLQSILALKIPELVTGGSLGRGNYGKPADDI